LIHHIYSAESREDFTERLEFEISELRKALEIARQS